MNKIIQLICFLAFASTTIAQKQIKILKPFRKHKKTYVKTNNRTKIYYPIKKKSGLKLRIKGPGILKVQSISQIEKSIPKSDFVYSYTLNGGIPSIASFKNVKQSKWVLKKTNSLAPSLEKSTRIVLGRGEHTLKFKKVSKNSIGLRFVFFKKRSKPQTWVSFQPKSIGSQQEIVVKESKTNYYNVSDSKSMKLNVIGPTTIRVMSRLIRTFEDKGRSKYKLQIKRNGSLENTFQLSSRKSSIAQLYPPSSNTLTKAKEISIQVPKGKHVYEFKNYKSGKKDILIRFMIPKNDLLITAQN